MRRSPQVLRDKCQRICGHFGSSTFSGQDLKGLFIVGHYPSLTSSQAALYSCSSLRISKKVRAYRLKLPPPQHLCETVDWIPRCLRYRGQRPRITRLPRDRIETDVRISRRSVHAEGLWGRCVCTQVSVLPDTYRPVTEESTFPFVPTSGRRPLQGKLKAQAEVMLE